MTWTIYDGVLTMTPVGGTASPLTVQLADYTVQTLSQYLMTQPGYVVIYQDTSANQLRSAIVLLAGTGNVAQSNGDHFYGYTSLLYSYADAIATELESAQAQIVNMLYQMSTTTAAQEFLDLQGTYYDVPRNTAGAVAETDTSYAPRIIANVLAPSSNNIGMALALEAQFPGTGFVITDAIDNGADLLLRDGSIFFNSEFVHNSNATAISGGLFDVDVTYPVTSSLDYVDLVPTVIAAVNRYRASGTYIRNLHLLNGPGASTPVTSFNVGPILVAVYD